LLFPSLARGRANARPRRRARPRRHPRLPRRQVGVGRIHRLPHLGAELEEGEQQDVGQGEALANDPFAAGDQAVEPGELGLGDGLQVVGGVRDGVDAVLDVSGR